MKKIAHIQVIPKLSGVQQVSYDILSGINCANVKKFIICGAADDELENEFRDVFTSANVKIITLESLKRNIGLHDIKCFLELYRLFKKERFDVVHTNSTKPGIVARIAAKFAGIPNVIHTVHGIAFHRHEKFIKRIFYYLLENIATLFGDENITVNNVYKKYYPLVKSKTIYNGVDFENFCLINKDNRDILHFAYIARLDEQKNPLEFIKAVSIVVQQYPQSLIRFTLGGRGELEEQCKKLIGSLNLNDVITMPGWISDKNKFYNSVDVLCQPSKWEAFGLVFVEAGFFKIPSIARAVEGIPEVVKDNYSGLLYQGGEYELADKMISLINDKSLLTKLGNNSKTYVSEHFDKKRMIKEYLDLYKL
ncbi:glycosyltransferase family 4 protein [Pluralibacter gergoviae]